jgi:hypothetical protein
MSRYQFSLAGLMALTTAIAVGTGLVAQLGLTGTLFAVMAGEMALLGGMCVTAAAWHRQPGWSGGMVIGLMFLAIAAMLGYFGFAIARFVEFRY